MTTRTTSREAYEHLVMSGELLGKQARIMDRLTTVGDATSGEVLAALKVRNVNAWRARFTELQARGLIVEVGTRRCAVSGRTCVVWHATDRTKPMDVRRGARGQRGDGAWREIAARLASMLEVTAEDNAVQPLIGETQLANTRRALADYRKLARARA